MGYPPPNGLPADLPGATLATRYVGGTATVAPTTGTFQVGDYVIAQNGAVFVCTVAGSPGTWVDAATIGPSVSSVFGRTGAVVAVDGDYYGVVAAAKTGATQASRYVGATTAGAPASGTFAVGDYIVDRGGLMWVCVTAGTPGSWVVAGSRQQLVTSAQGLISQNFDRQTSANSSALVSGTVYGMLVGLYAGEIVTNLVIGVDSGGTLLTLTKCALYSTAGARLALSADQGTNWQSAGIYTVPMTAPFTVITTGAYYAAVLAVGSVGPGLSRSSNSTAASLAIGASARPVANQSGQTDMPSPATFANGTNFAPWIGVS